MRRNVSPLVTVVVVLVVVVVATFLYMRAGRKAQLSEGAQQTALQAQRYGSGGDLSEEQRQARRERRDRRLGAKGR